MGSYDPFQPRPSGLLLVEEFARLDLVQFRVVEAWVMANGPPTGNGEWGEESLWTVADRQAEVREHLRVLEVLSSRHAISEPWQWEPKFGHLLDEDGGIAVAETDYARWAATRASVAQGQAARDEAVALAFRRAALALQGRPRRRTRRKRLGARATLKITIDSCLAVIAQETPPRFVVQARPSGWPAVSVSLESGWTSAEQPMFHQLLEAALRVGEGRPAAKRCRLCGQVFLALDERREFYCNRLERDRFNQRAKRMRDQAVHADS